ncbi:hypothetical protein OKW76_06650 [Sphingomonas sp. S1-29]|uniref:hypothetical protein n=1 Tax=Sphingomonas sp. S1-29 TaxID=2991074 RepID=UPI00224008CC|nr:hypothetical protein [Sphingomonas sp. S1-29]UZK70698.1 hypothetical protein OKW76_06650 [Sphingomonas sp. S1-29]
MFKRPLPGWYWIASALIVLWGAMGVFAFYTDATMSDAALAALPAWDRAFYQARPGWFVWVYGIATWGGLLGGVALLAKRRLAIALFGVSLAAIVVQFGYVFLATDIVAAKGAAATVPFPLLIAAVGVVQLWLARTAAARGWLR